MKAGFSLWISNESGKKMFGAGPYKLLLLVDELGSLNKATKVMKISYSKAIRILNMAEKELGIKLLDKEIGGATGGGSSLTLEAREFVNKYGAYIERISLEVDKVFDDMWGSS